VAHQLVLRTLYTCSSGYLNQADCTLLVNPKDDEVELAALRHIPFDQIIGWFDDFIRIQGRVIDFKFFENPQFDKVKYHEKKDSGAQYQLAGFPAGHEARDEEPWINFVDCKDQSIRPNPDRRANSIVAREGMGKLHSSGKPKTAPLETTLKSTPKIAPPKTAPPKTAPPETAPLSKTTPTKATPLKICTPAKKKAGKCKEQAKHTCRRVKTNREFYMEFIKLLELGKPPKSGASRTNRRPKFTPSLGGS
jgi:hypothetical protein